MSTVQLTKFNVISILAQHFANKPTEQLDATECENKINEVVSTAAQLKGVDLGEAKKVYAPIIASVVSHGIPNTYKELLVESILSKVFLMGAEEKKLEAIFSAIDPKKQEQLTVLEALERSLTTAATITDEANKKNFQVLSGALRMIEKFPSIDSSRTLKQQVSEVQRKLVELLHPQTEKATQGDRAQEPEGETSMWQSALKWARRGIVTILTALGAKNLLFNSESGWVRPIVQLLAAFGISRIDFESHENEERTPAPQPAQ